MKILFAEIGWKHYLYWYEADAKIFERINTLIKDISRGGRIGKAEYLKGNLSGYASRRIDDHHRLVYKVEGDILTVLHCFGHYGVK